MRRFLRAAVGLLLAAAITTPLAASDFSHRIQLPKGFAPEGIAIGHGPTFYTGSLSGQGIWRGNLRTGAGEFLVEGGGPFVGMKVDGRNRLWVAGGPAGVGYVFNAGNGNLKRTISFTSDPSFINDVIVTRRATYFTDSFTPVIYRVAIGRHGGIGAVSTIALDPAEIGFVPGAFNLNGIEAAWGGHYLIVVNSTSGELYRINPRNGRARSIDLGGYSVAAGDGLLRAGRTLFVVRNEFNLVAVVRLQADLLDGRLVEELTARSFDFPTTAAKFDGSLYVVNARFSTPVTPDTRYWVTRLHR
jgi:hypothetical protein